MPDKIRACLFDLDGVLTQTALVHAAAWQEMFDSFLREQASRTGQPFVAFDPASDYDRYVDGRPRAQGVTTFLASRGIELPAGHPGDAPDAGTVEGLAGWKNEILQRRLATDGVQSYPGSVRYLQAVAQAGLARAVVSSSANCRQMLAAAALDGYFPVVVDGVLARHEGLAGKPAPDTYLAGARALDVPPGAAAVFEDAQAGVAAGRAGRFGWVIGVDRTGQAGALRKEGADIVVEDLAELLDSA